MGGFSAKGAFVLPHLTRLTIQGRWASKSGASGSSHACLLLLRMWDGWPEQRTRTLPGSWDGKRRLFVIRLRRTVTSFLGLAGPGLVVVRVGNAVALLDVAIAEGGTDAGSARRICRSKLKRENKRHQEWHVGSSRCQESQITASLSRHRWKTCAPQSWGAVSVAKQRRPSALRHELLRQRRQAHDGTSACQDKAPPRAERHKCLRPENVSPSAAWYNATTFAASLNADSAPVDPSARTHSSPPNNSNARISLVVSSSTCLLLNFSHPVSFGSSEAIGRVCRACHATVCTSIPGRPGS